MTTSEFLTTRQAAALLSVSPEYLELHRRLGDGPPWVKLTDAPRLGAARSLPSPSTPPDGWSRLRGLARMTPEFPRRLPVPCPWPCSSHPCPGRSRRSAQSDAGATLAREPARSTGPAVGGDTAHDHYRSEHRRVGQSVSVRVDLGGRRIIKKKTKK